MRRRHLDMIEDDICGSSGTLTKITTVLRNVCSKGMKHLEQRQQMRIGGGTGFVVMDESNFRHKRKVLCHTSENSFCKCKWPRKLHFLLPLEVLINIWQWLCMLQTISVSYVFCLFFLSLAVCKRPVWGYRAEKVLGFRDVRSERKWQKANSEQKNKTGVGPTCSQYVKSGSNIITDCWRAYERLSQDGYIHYQVNHRRHFVHPQTGCHTQHASGGTKHP